MSGIVTDQSNHRGADRLVGATIAGLGTLVFIGALNMPTFEDRSVSPWTVPGIFPAFVGAVLALLGTALALRNAPPIRTQSKSERPQMGGLIGMLALGLAYIALVGHVPFAPLTIVFLAGFALVFRPMALSGQRPYWAIAGVALFVGLIGFGIPTLFETVFLVTLP